MEGLRETVRSALGSNDGSPDHAARSRATSGSSEWTSTYGGESSASVESEGRPEEAWLRRMLAGAQMPTTALENGQESVMNDLEAVEHGLKMICFAKITEAVEAGSRARAAMEQLMRIQAKEREQNRQRLLILEQYKDISQKLAIENSLLKEQLASSKGLKSSASLPGQSTGRSTVNITDEDSAEGEGKVGGDVREAKEEALREIEEAHNQRPPSID
ncbi:hypothetical protein BIW11_07863 [Tropilaelaps mercedesae]|uniref:Uncharacterized protein n=1 Tax=Tropilaelaps mercedesae TaxID=418985 RepID=A0A1V9XS33_9ACAR|nr:hypothetical protein BIW11_07863 [Tropilaelaps mercedesae]